MGGPGHRLPRRVFLALLGLTHVIAFASFWSQAHGLVGEHGIVPAGPWLAQVGEVLRGDGRAPWLEVPTLGWLGAGDTALTVLGACGVLGGALLAVGVAPRLLCAVLWLLYLSVFNLGGPFLRFQWDILLIEATFLAIFYAPEGWWRPVAAQGEPSAAARWMLRLLVFKVMLMSGVVKLTSGDATWADLTALDFHFFTQPLPHALAWHAHNAPEGVRHGGVILTFVAELLLPWLIIFQPRGWRLALLGIGTAVGLLVTGGHVTLAFAAVFAGAAMLLDDRLVGRLLPTLAEGARSGSRPVAFWGVVLLMGAIASTGNYGFFNLLTVALAFTLLDDAALRRALPARVRGRVAPSAGTPPSRAWVATVALAAALLVPLSGLKMVNMAGRQTLHAAFEAVLAHDASAAQRVLAWAVEAQDKAFGLIGGFATVNGYGLFATMTTERGELVVEGSRDGVGWTPYRFAYKPDEPTRVGPVVGVHMPRLDWQMWFAALRSSCRGGWFVAFVRRLLEGAPTVTALLAEDPFAGAPPQWVRVRRVDYTFTTAAERALTGRVWKTRDAGLYCPALSLRELRALQEP